MHDVLYENARLYPMGPSVHPVPEGCFAIKDGRFSALGETVRARRRLDLEGKLVLPGLVDCHTHLVYAGDRSSEHAMRLEGRSYREIARAGGGILATVEAVRAASEDELVETALPRARCLAREGVTTLEVKSGYGLDTPNEIKMLRAIRRLGELLPIRIRATFLGAHAVPPGQSRAGYMREILDETLPAVAEAGLADAVDIYLEDFAFDLEDLESLAARSAELGLPLRAHSEQLSAMGGTAAAARLGALSCDHLEYANSEDVAAMAENDTVAVLLPGAFYFLRESRRPPVPALREAGVRMAVASDLNPGSSPVPSLLICAHMACVFFGLSAVEAIEGITRHGAAAMGIGDEAGSIAIGRQADFTVWDLATPEQLVYQLGGLYPHRVYVKGEPL
ncbi:MAG: imidazolonepropionase [Gammaproteobacteria bacterium]